MQIAHKLMRFSKGYPLQHLIWSSSYFSKGTLQILKQGMQQESLARSPGMTVK